jgi:antitoxin HicB
MEYSIVLIPEPEEGGYSVIVPLLPGCFTQGETLEEALANAKEAIEVHLEGLALDKQPIPEQGQAPLLATIAVNPDLSVGITGEQFGRLT